MQRQWTGDDRHLMGRGGRATASVLALVFLCCTVLVTSGPLRVSRASAARSVTTAVQQHGTTTASAGCGKTPPFAPGHTGVGTLPSGGRLRSYRLHIPRKYVSDTAYPLLLSFHGHGGTAAHQERVTGFSQLADQAGFLVAYPQGAVGTDGLTGWASGGVGRPTVNDVLFVSELLSNLQAQVCVNPKRIYATGFSNGGGMTSLLACDLPDRIAAFASVAGSYYVPEGGCHPSRPVPILEFHGTSDPVVPYAGRPAQGELGVMEWLDEWAARDACGASPLTTALRNGITQLIWSDCAHGASVVHYRLTDGLHTWPTQSTSGTQQLPRSDTALNATILIWHFFEAHALPAA